MLTPALSMNTNRLFVFALLILSTPIVRADSAATTGGLQPGDLVAICGDSITEQRLYTVDMADYLLMCQPQPKLSAIQFGWSGERAPQFLARMQNDALVFKPTVATTLYGMNDGGYGPSNPQILDTYRESMTKIVQTLKASGVRFIVVGTPGAVDTHTFHPAKDQKGPTDASTVYNKTLGELGDIDREIAKKEGVGFADVHDTMLTVMAKAKAANGEAFQVAGPDGVHPQPDGHIVMAYAFLKALGCDGNIGTITVDMKANQAQATDGTTVDSDTNGTVELESTRYPFCFYGTDLKDPTSTRSILPFLPFNEDLNRYMLVVKNAPSARMKVTWGKMSKTFSADELAKGVNLAAEFLDNPFSDAFKAVQTKIAQQQAFETVASKQLLHGIPDWEKEVPEIKDLLDQVPPRLFSKLQTMRDTSVAAIVPVKHEIKIEAAP